MLATDVEVMWTALERAWRKAEYEELWLQFRPRGSKDVFDAVEEAVRVANQTVEDQGWGDVVFTEGVSDSDAGPVALMSRAGPEPGVRSWFAAFARHLQALGKAGKITAAPQMFFPAWRSGEIELPRQLTAFVAYKTDDLTHLTEMDRHGGWHVPVALTEKVADMGVEWGTFAGADVYLLRNIHQIRTKNPEVGPQLADGVAKYGLAGVTYLQSEPRHMTSLFLGTQGRAVYEVMDETKSWQDRLEHVARTIDAFPEHTDLAFVQYSTVDSINWSALASGTPPLPFVHEYHVRYNRHLYTDYIPDVHGIQLLTDAHLERAHDLSDWVIEPLAGGRHLVRARDLEPWYAQPDPDSATLAKARADFTPIILTPEIIANNPPPWHS